MNKFEIKQDTPRLIVEFKRSADGKEQFGWGMVGQMPMLTLIGAVARAQADLQFRTLDNIPHTALVIALDVDTGKFHSFTNPEIPVDSLIGMLESVKMTLVQAQMTQMQRQAELGIVGPNGRPIPQKRF